jgi:glyoxylate utilization-related uncharacterized protein
VPERMRCRGGRISCVIDDRSHLRAEAFYVLEGELQFTTGDETVTTSKESFLFAPAVSCTASGVHRISRQKRLVIVSPGGFEKALQDRAEAVFSAAEPPDIDRLLAIAAN